MLKKEDYCCEFDRNCGANAVNEVLERNFYDFCISLIAKGYNENSITEENAGATQVINEYCRSLAVKHLQERNYYIAPLVDLLLCGGDYAFYDYNNFVH